MGAWLVLLVGAALGTGCGGEDAVRFAEPQVVEVGARELDGAAGVGFVLEVRRLRVEPTGWAVEARVVNATPVR